MKVLFLSRYQKTINRGAETFVKELSQRLKKEHQVVILSGKDSDSIDKIIQSKPDIVISMNGRFQSLKASLGRIFGKYKLVITGQSGIGRDDIWNIAVVKPDVYVGITSHEANWAKKWAWGTKVVKINNGVSIEKFSSDGKKVNLGFDEPIILSVGALEWYKHHELTIEAVSKLEKGSLLLVGKGELESKLKTKGERLLGNRFKIISAKYEDLPPIYRSSNLFMLPSWDRESFGIVYIEAMASGLPIVAPNDSPRREIIGNAGVLVDGKDPSNYAKAIEQVLKTKWRDRPKNQAVKFSWEKIAKDYNQLFNELINETQTHS